MKLPFIQSPGQRGSLMTEDDIIINGFPEQLADGRVALVKRKGVTSHQAPTTTSTPRGMWLFNGELVSIYGSKLFHGTTEIGTDAIAGSGPCWAVEYGTTTKYLAISNGTTGYRLSTAWALTTVTDGDFQTHVHGVAHLDGYLFTLASSGQIAHSDIRDFTAWTAGNVINAESFPDGGVAIARHINYIAAIGNDTIEFFYDAANATGSVLSRVSGAILNIGCANARTLADYKQMPIFVSAGGSVYMLSSMQPQRISNPAIERILSAATLTDAYAMTFEYAGHAFYVLTMPTTNVTLAYDISTKRWLQLQDPDGNYWPYVNAVQSGGEVYFQRGNGTTYKISGWQDAGSNYSVKARTAWVDFGTGRRKKIRSMEVFSDLSTGSVSMRYSKDDFTNWSTARTASLAGRAQFWRLGEFRRIAFEFSHTANEDIRLIDVEIDIPGMQNGG